MSLIDTHTHLYLGEFDNDRDEAVSRAISCDVEALLLPNIDCESVRGMLKLTSTFNGICYPMAGLHPTSVREDFAERFSEISTLLDGKEIVGVGETGIDLYWDKKFIREQEEAFRIHVEYASEKDLPLVIHSRESFNKIVKILRESKEKNLRGVFHAFTGSVEQAEIITGMGFYLGIGGIVTFKNSGLAEVVNQLPHDRILLETDSPFLAPVPKRGKRNESSYLVHIARKVAEATGLKEEEVAEITTANAKELFGI